MKPSLLFCSLLLAFSSLYSQGLETFNNMPASSSSYETRNWVGDNGLAWTATDARTDRDADINGRAIGVRVGRVTCNNIPNGIATLQFSFRYLFAAGGDGRIVIRINGDSITQVVVPTTAGTNQVSPVFTINRAGTFNLELVQANPRSGNGPRIAIDDVAWTAFANTTPCVAPAAQPTALVFSTITTGSISGSFTPANPAANKYLVLISTANSLSQLPINGTTYSQDEVLGNAVVVSQSAATTFVADGLLSGTAYYFTVFAYNDLCVGGPLYNGASMLMGSTTTATPVVCAAPANPPGTLAFGTITNTSISGTFAASATADSYLVLVSPTSSLGFVPTNGTAYTVGQSLGSGTVIKFGAGTGFLASGLTPSTPYFFHVFALNNASCTGGPQYNSTAATGTTSTSNSNTGIPPGYYASITNQTCATLKTALRDVISAGAVARTYGDLIGQYALTDIKPREVGSGSANVIWDIYSDLPGPNNDPYNYTTTQNSCGSGEGTGWNREHSVPQSWFTGNTNPGPGTDYHHIFPTDCAVNSARGSFIYGEVAAANYTSQNGSKKGSSAIAGFSGEVFEPINEYKGDVARAFLYFVTRYQSNMTSWSGGSNGTQAMDPTTFPSVDVPYLKLMLQWHNQDPVSTKEIVRNNGGYDFQGNRNPYVDRPELVDLVWNANCAGLSTLPVDLLTFGGKLNGNMVNLSWQVANEQNLQAYVVERSLNGKDYTALAQRSAIGSAQYSYADNISSLAGRRLYYRIRMANKDGSFRHSRIFTLHTPQNTMFSVYPNPVTRGPLTVVVSSGTSGGTLQVLDMAGRQLMQKAFAGPGQIQLQLNHLPSGSYLLRMQANGTSAQSRIQVSK